MKIKFAIVLSFILIPIQYFILKKAKENDLISENQFSTLSISFGGVLFIIMASLAGASSAITANESQPSGEQNKTSFIDKTLNQDASQIIKKTSDEVVDSLESTLKPLINIPQYLYKIINWIPIIATVISMIFKFKTIICSFPINSITQVKNWFISLYCFVKNNVMPLFSRSKNRIKQ